MCVSSNRPWLVFSFLLLLPSCSDDSAAGPRDDAGSLRDGLAETIHSDTLLPDQHSGVPDSAPDAGRPVACLDQDTRLQAALDEARESPNAMLVIINPACGTTVYLSGNPATATADSLWRVGSVSKTYLAAMILTLVREGKLALDDLLSKWIPDVPATEGVTVRMLLNHTSGIFNYTDDAKFFSDPLKEWIPQELVAVATKHSPYFSPGAGWHYSNTNYILLGLIAEQAGAAAAHALIRLRALVPAGLKQTFFEGQETLQGTLATGFDEKLNDITHAYSMSWPWTAGAMAATGADLCTWIKTLLGTTKILSAAEQQTMLEGVSTDIPSMNYGLGVMLLDPSVTAGAGPALGHGGDIFGYHTQAFWFPNKETAICAVVNQDEVSPNDLTVAALHALFIK